MTAPKTTNPICLFYTLRRICLPAFLFLLIPTFVKAQQKTLGMTVHRQGSTEEGYVLFAPMGSRTTYLVNKCGQKVHSWPSQYPPGLSVFLLPDGNLLRTGITQDTFFVASGKGGIIEKIDWSGKVIWSYTIANDSLGQHHDIYPMENGNILVIAWHGIPESKAIANGRYKGTIGGPKLWSERILELKPKGTNDAEVVWQWSLWDHIIQDENIAKPDFNMISNHPELMNVNYAPQFSPDWIHMNSVAYNKDLDQIILSCHNNSEVWIIDHSTTTAEAASHFGGNSGKGGDLLYRWGNPAAYNRGGKNNQKFFRQHNAYWIPSHYKDGGDIMVFNNGLGRSPAYSTVEIISPPMVSKGVYNTSMPFGPSTQKWIYKDSVPTNFYSPVISGAQRMPNGNTMICSGNPGRLFEITPQNAVVWVYINPVSADDQILSDGDQPSGNSVFRCIYYADTFSAFKGKDLMPKGTVEKNPYSYSCSLEPPDIIAPSVLNYIPALNSRDVDLTSDLLIKFDETVLKGSQGFVKIFENNSLKESIAIDNNRIQLNNTLVSITPGSPFKYNSRVGVSFDQGCFKDSAANPVAATDTASWAFNTPVMVGIQEVRAFQSGKLYPNPALDYLLLLQGNSSAKIELINSTGVLVNDWTAEFSNGKFMIDVRNLPCGIYSLKADGQYKGLWMKQ